MFMFFYAILRSTTSEGQQFMSMCVLRVPLNETRCVMALKSTKVRKKTCLKSWQRPRHAHQLIEVGRAVGHAGHVRACQRLDGFAQTGRFVENGHAVPAAQSQQAVQRRLGDVAVGDEEGGRGYLILEVGDVVGRD